MTPEARLEELEERVRALEAMLLPATEFHRAMREAAKGNKGPIQEYFRRGGWFPGQKKPSPAPNG